MDERLTDETEKRISYYTMLCNLDSIKLMK